MNTSKTNDNASENRDLGKIVTIAEDISTLGAGIVDEHITLLLLKKLL